MLRLVLIIFALTFPALVFYSQNEAKIWYFGANAGLDFNTVPPTVLTNGSINTLEGCATISDASGALLFYTDGMTAWDKTHAIMANGTGMKGHQSTTQSALIVRKPGSSTIYYIFSLKANGSGPEAGSLWYSIVDIALAAGNGSVTAKNIPLATNMTEKLAGVMHCNGKDVWVVSHDENSNNFRAFLVTSAGVNLTPVNTAYGTVHGGNAYWSLGYLKFSPNGRKLGLVIQEGLIELYDFDKATGIVSNSLTLYNSTPSNNGQFGGPYGCEFSPDGTKFYGTVSSAGFIGFCQWDLCAGSNSAIVASQYNHTLTVNSLNSLRAMQVAPNGKIYVGRNSTFLSVINNPNAAGAACSFTYSGQTIAPGATNWSIPNFINDFANNLSQPQPFTFSVNCGVVSYAAPQTYSTGSAGCTAVGYSMTGMQWDFGDTSSGVVNNATSTNPSHAYSTPGSYTTQLIINYSCSSDTISLPIFIPAVTNLSVSGMFNICTGGQAVYTVSGANTYTWSNSLNTPTVLLSPGTTTAFSVTGVNTLNGCSAVNFFTVIVSKCVGIEEETELLNNLRIYPSPVTDILKIEVPAKVIFSVINISGEILLVKSFVEGLNEMDLSSLSAGIYIVKVSYNNGAVRIIRFVKSDPE